MEYSLWENMLIKRVNQFIDITIYFLFLARLLLKFKSSTYKSIYFKENIFEIIAFIVLSIMILYYPYQIFIEKKIINTIAVKIIILLAIFVGMKALTRIKKLNYFLKNLTTHPAKTIVLSFFAVILTGTTLLMLPFSTIDYTKLGFVNALFTATSATCVTGLIVVDTATKFSLYGKLIILALIQVGGLGIMILSYFAMFIMGRKLSIQEKLNVSYLLNEKDIANLSNIVKKIILFTFSIEIGGALLLYFCFHDTSKPEITPILFSIFHSISAFCNAGFSLFSNSLENYTTTPSINLIIAGLIILGGLSFAVLLNISQYINSLFKIKILGKEEIQKKITLNTKIVSFMTIILLLSGMLLIYFFEHRTNLIQYPIGTQYLAAFFQSVTLRTAGFNTIDFTCLNTCTYLLMLLFMFIGGASGSTAGGIKLNTVGVIYAYIKNMFSQKENVTLLKHSLAKNLVNQAFLIIILALVSIFFGVLILSITENKELTQILFEVVSAFGTVGLTTGITSQLSIPGKFTIISLMFIGRIGPLTIIAAFSQKKKSSQIKYPEAHINIG